jgi:hypothetical protein
MLSYIKGNRIENFFRLSDFLYFSNVRLNFGRRIYTDVFTFIPFSCSYIPTFQGGPVGDIIKSNIVQCFKTTTEFHIPPTCLKLSFSLCVLMKVS